MGEFWNAAAWTKDMSQRPNHIGHILFLSGEPRSKGHIYRVLNRVEALRGTGWTADIFDDPSLVTEEKLQAASLVWVFRKTYDGALDALYVRARNSGCPILFDIDDLVFDPNRSGPSSIRYLETISLDRRKAWQARVPLYRKALERADFTCFPTQTLAEEARLIGPQTLVLRNGLNQAQVSLANSLKSKLTRDQVTIGYASGSPSHHHDFLEAVFPLTDVLARRRNARFQKTGHLDLSLYPVLCPYRDQIQEHGSVPYNQLPVALSDYDINLAPLEWDSSFSHGKSELKFFEAALLDCPTIATATQPFWDAIETGKTGFLVREGKEWYDALMTLIDDPESRKRMGQKAYRSAIAQFGPEQQKADLLVLLKRVTDHGV